MTCVTDRLTSPSHTKAVRNLVKQEEQLWFLETFPQRLGPDFPWPLFGCWEQGRCCSVPHTMGTHTGPSGQTIPETSLAFPEFIHSQSCGGMGRRMGCFSKQGKGLKHWCDPSQQQHVFPWAQPCPSGASQGINLQSLTCL